VAPNLAAADKRSRKSPESIIWSVLRWHELREIGRAGAYFNDLSELQTEKDSMAEQGELGMSAALLELSSGDIVS